MNDVKTLKKIYADRKHTINGTEYEFDKIKFKSAKTLLAFLSLIEQDLAQGIVGFLDHAVFDDKILPIIEDSIKVGGLQISKTPDYWEKNTADFVPLILIALPVLTMVFSEGNIE